MADDGFRLPDDVLVKILLLIPGIRRQKFRHVCKGWRGLIDERTPKLKYRAQILVFLTERGSSRALVFDGKDGLHKQEWTFSSCEKRDHVFMVGTCNGLLCLHDDSRSFEGFSLSTITVTNPITGERLELPAVPTPWKWDHLGSPGKYSFGYHPATGQYKVVHIPVQRRRQTFSALQVFTLGDKMWQEVQVAPDASCSLSSEPLSLGGCTYWLTASSNRVMALDLKDERVTSFAVPPVRKPAGPIPPQVRWQWTNVHGSLGVVASACTPTVANVWVMEGGGEQTRWSHRYKITDMQRFWIVAPQLTYGDYMLSMSRIRANFWYYLAVRLYRHKHGNLTDSNGETREHRPTEETEVDMIMEEITNGGVTTFAYIETLEPVPR